MKIIPWIICERRKIERVDIFPILSPWFEILDIANAVKRREVEGIRRGRNVGAR